MKTCRIIFFSFDVLRGKVYPVKNKSSMIQWNKNGKGPPGTFFFRFNFFFYKFDYKMQANNGIVTNQRYQSLFTFILTTCLHSKQQCLNKKYFMSPKIPTKELPKEIMEIQHWLSSIRDNILFIILCFESFTSSFITIKF